MDVTFALDLKNAGASLKAAGAELIKVKNAYQKNAGTNMVTAGNALIAAAVKMEAVLGAANIDNTLEKVTYNGIVIDGGNSV